MDNYILLRRTIHLMIAITPLYYFLPDEIPVIGTNHWIILLTSMVFLAIVEGSRLYLGIMFPGMRPYEKSQIASYVWASMGVVVALSFMPMDIGSACIIGMAITDPVAGELRKRYAQPATSIIPPIVLYFALCASVLVSMDSLSWYQISVICAVGSVSAVFSERWKTRYFDDDFLMIVVPGTLMTALSLMS